LNSERPTLVHPTDYGPGGQLAFAHAVGLALRGKYALSLLNIDTGNLSQHHTGVGEVVDCLVRWKMAPPEAGAEILESKFDLPVLGVRIPASDVRAGVLDFLDNHLTDLVVISTREHRGLSRWLERSLAVRTMSRASSLALMIREGGRGFVDAATGAMKLERILVPVDDHVDLTGALARLEAFADGLGGGIDIRLLHIGADASGLMLPHGGKSYPLMLREGPVPETILSVARQVSADVIAMPTSKRNDVFAALRGSVTAAILDDASWAVLSVPAG
jgi:nucleotide-binding universal stress UspA family protein